MSELSSNQQSQVELQFRIRRKRWLNVGAVYLILILISFLFMGPFLFGAISSLKDNPTEWPPTIQTAQLSPRNWLGAFNLARQAGSGGLFGQFKAGKMVQLKVTYRFPAGHEVVLPEVSIPVRVAGSGQAALDLTQKYAADYLEVSAVEEIKRWTEGGAIYTEYQIMISNPSHFNFDIVPLNLKVPYQVEFVQGTLTPNNIERLGMVQSWKNISSGLIPYIFHNYDRVFNENYSRSTGRSLFLSWVLNSFFISIMRVITTLILAAMAGYVLARLKFVGQKLFFVLILFSMMIPAQVTFISNYLVLRDGIFGLSKMFGVNSLLNTFSGLIIQGMVSGSAVFIMKQFFAGLPRSLEESACIDGASTYQTFFKIMLPLAKPALGALTILTFQGTWNDFFMPLVIITSPMDKFPLTVGLLSFRIMYGAAGMAWGPILAGAIISALPIIILFVVFQKYFVEGISFSGLKG